MNEYGYEWTMMLQIILSCLCVYIYFPMLIFQRFSNERELLS